MLNVRIKVLLLHDHVSTVIEFLLKTDPRKLSDQSAWLSNTQKVTIFFWSQVLESSFIFFFFWDTPLIPLAEKVNTYNIKLTIEDMEKPLYTIQCASYT